MAASNFSGPIVVNGVEAIDENGNVVAPIQDTLAEGSIYIGDSSNVTSEVDFSTDTYIGVGDGTTFNSVAMSGDATIANDGTVTVDAATGDFTSGGAVIRGGTTATSGAGAVAITGAIHEVTTTGTGDALTLADGTAGQRLSVIYVAEGAGGDTAVITPTTLAGGTTITLNNLGDSCDLVFSSTGGWYVLGLGGAAAVA